MKKIHEMIGIALLMLLSITSCKDKPANDSIDTVPPETPIDNTATPETVPPTVDTVPGVGSGIGDEQVP